jgi:hypothetical protein
MTEPTVDKLAIAKLLGLNSRDANEVAMSMDLATAMEARDRERKVNGRAAVNAALSRRIRTLRGW